MKILSVNIVPIAYCEPIDYYKNQITSVPSILYTGKGEKDLSEFSLIGCTPVAIIELSPGRSCLKTQSYEKSIEFRPWDELSKLITDLKFDKYEYPANKCGVCGFWSYELRHTLESLPKLNKNSYSLPDAIYTLFSNFYYFDHDSKRSWKIDFEYNLSPIHGIQQCNDNHYNITNLRANFSKEEYCDKVNRVRDYIYSGEVYEVNLSQQFEADFEGNSLQYFLDLYHRNPAPFSAFMNYSDYQILSLSPEQFIKCEGDRVETRPIKGTAPRYADKLKDKQSKENLINSEKDKAELHMIVDLLRNDLSKSCRVGSVDVVNPHRLEKYENVWHLVAIIKGLLDTDSSYIDIVKGAFPGGSITGCPKIRSMEIIEELEVSQRNLYTGSIFIVNKAFLQSSIVIRTGIITESLTTNNRKLFFNSGGAVTIDSVPESEYDEIIQKVTHFIASEKEDK